MAKNSMADQIRQYASVQNIVRIAQIANDLGHPKDKVRYAVKVLVDQGFLIRISHGMYEFSEKREDAQESPVLDKVWRSMRINPTFTTSDISRQAGSTLNYIHKLFRKFRANDFIKQSGTRKNLNGDSERVWRLTPAGQEQSRNSKQVVFKPDPLIEDTVNFNRLVCTGMVGLNERYHLEALRLLTRIEDKLIQNWKM